MFIEVAAFRRTSVDGKPFEGYRLVTINTYRILSVRKPLNPSTSGCALILKDAEDGYSKDHGRTHSINIKDSYSDIIGKLKAQKSAEKEDQL